MYTSHENQCTPQYMNSWICDSERDKKFAEYMNRLKQINYFETRSLFKKNDETAQHNVKLELMIDQEKVDTINRVLKTMPHLKHFLEDCAIGRLFDCTFKKPKFLDIFVKDYTKEILIFEEHEFYYIFALGFMKNKRQRVKMLENTTIWSVKNSEELIHRNFQNNIEKLEKMEHYPSEILDKVIGFSNITTSYNKNVKYTKKSFKVLNGQQQKFIKVVMNNSITLLRGPPGTGKTTTIAALSEILKNKLMPNEVILITAHSNTAVDNMTEKLIKNKQKVVRFLGLSAKYKKSIKGHYYFEKEHSLYKNKKKMKLIKEWLSHKQFICCTLSLVNSVIRRFINKTNIPYTIVDEAGQQGELSSIFGLNKNTRKLILIGDDKQLGPVIHNSISKSLNYKSMYTRLISNKNNDFMMLKVHYRCHPSISDIFSQIHYNKQLVSGISIRKRTPPQALSQIFNLKKPYLFVNIEGKEKLQKSSFINHKEAKVVIKYLKKLINLGIRNIGVIATYHNQVQHLKKMFRIRNGELNGVEINTVDGFQGREKDYIIISTVRSNIKNNIGFLKDKCRMNVAISRAKFGMIVVGNAKTISTSEAWNHFIRIAKKQINFISK